MESSRPPTMAKKLWQMFHVVYYMIQKGVSKRKVMMDLQFLLKRGKVLGKAFSNLITAFHHHHHGSSSFWCASMDPNFSIYNPREVEFSCSNTPSYPSFVLNKRKNRNHHYDRNNFAEYEAIAAIVNALESSNSEVASDGECSVAPSPMVGFRVMSTPRMVRQVRITDSPFPIKEDGVDADGKVDKEAEEFIRQFYEQLKVQQSQAVATPDYRLRRGRGGVCTCCQSGLI